MGASNEKARPSDRPKEVNPTAKGAVPLKALSVILEDAEVMELVRILMDDDARGALDFLKVHFKGQVKDLFEGGCR